MALVYFDSRWKQNAQNTAPGPGQYDTAQDRPKTKQSQNRSRMTIKKTVPIVSPPKEREPPTLQECSNHERIHGGSDQNAQMRKEALKKGKIYRKNTGAKHRDSMQQQLSYDFEVKNGDRSQMLVGIRNKWVNKRIVEMMHEQKEKQNKSRSKLKHNPSINKSNYLSNIQREKLQQELKDIEILYKRQTHKGQSLNNVKYINREISSKQKERQNKSHNYISSISRGVNAGQIFEKDVKQLTVQAVAVCKSLQEETQQFILPRNTFDVHPSTTLSSLKRVLRDKDDSMPTGCSDDMLDDSVEYIDDATPGPGSYNLANKSMVKAGGSKVQKFGVTIDRFKSKRGWEAQTNITPVYPDFKATSKARQEAVGFGRTTKQEQDQKKVHSGVFYEDNNTLENIAKKNLIKSKSQKIGFQSCQERFEYIGKKKSTFSEDESPEIPPQEEEQTETIPNSVFISKVQRDMPVPTVTENVDFTGQNIGCLAYKLVKQQEYFEDYEIDPVSFNTRQTRFKYEEPKPESKKEELKLLKIKELKEKQEKKLKKAPKGYSFGKDIKKETVHDKVPSPDKYDCGPEWIKKSYNLRFS